MEDVLTDEERERGLSVLHRAIEIEKTGQDGSNLWGRLLNACRFVPERVNLLVQEFSDDIAQGSPKPDLLDYRGLLLVKTEHHRHLVSALLAAECFLNGRLTHETSMTLFDNEERLSAILTVSSFLTDALLKDIIRKAGSLIDESDGVEDSVEEITDLDKFFALTKDAPHCLARAISDTCVEFLSMKRRAMGINEDFQTFKSLFSLAHGMLSSGEQRRHHLEHHHQREGKALKQCRVYDWMYGRSLLFMWDNLLHTGTKMLVRASELDLFSAKQLAHMSITTAGRLCSTLQHLLEHEVEDTLQLGELPERFRDVQSLADQFLCTIIACCFNESKTVIGDEAIKTEILALSKEYCCYQAIYDLLCKYNDDGVQLIQLMIHWDPSHRKSYRNSLTYIVFSKWLEKGGVKDLEHLLKGPSCLDHELANFLEDHGRKDLLLLVQIRMGKVAEARNTLLSKQGELTFDDRSTLFLLTYADPASDEALIKSSYLELRLRNIVRTFALQVTRLDSISILKRLLGLLEKTESPRVEEVMKTTLDVFCLSKQDFVQKYREEWKLYWRLVGRCTRSKLSSFMLPEEHNHAYFLQDCSRLLVKASQKLKMNTQEKEIVLEEILSGFDSEDDSEHRSLVEMVCNTLGLPLLNVC